MITFVITYVVEVMTGVGCFEAFQIKWIFGRPFSNIEVARV
jgi:hypothetical protein